VNHGRSQTHSQRGVYNNKLVFPIPPIP
jgi:hypothetical protein